MCDSQYVDAATVAQCTDQPAAATARRAGHVATADPSIDAAKDTSLAGRDYPLNPTFHPHPVALGARRPRCGATNCVCLSYECVSVVKCRSTWHRPPRTVRFNFQHYPALSTPTAHTPGAFRRAADDLEWTPGLVHKRGTRGAPLQRVVSLLLRADAVYPPYLGLPALNAHCTHFG